MPQKRPSQTLRAIVLQVRNVGEGHRMVDAWVYGVGRISLWARHARSSKRRFGSALSPFSLLQITATPDDALWKLESAEAQGDRMGIRASLQGIGRAATLVRVVQALWPTGHDAEGVFEGLTVALDHLDGGRMARAAGLYPRLAALGGLLPSTEQCGNCQRPLAHRICAPVGKPALLCGNCAPHGAALPQATVAALAGARIEDELVAVQVEAIVTQWVSLFTGKKLVPFAAPALLKRPASP